MAYSSPPRDRYTDTVASALALVSLPFTSRYTSCSPPRKPRRQKFFMLSKKPMELVSITFSHHHPQAVPTTEALPIQLKTDTGRTIILEKPGIHLDPSVHGDHPSPPHTPALAIPTDSTCSVRLFSIPLSSSHHLPTRLSFQCFFA
jgi:hypothetical protein